MKASYVLAVLALAGCAEATSPTSHSSPTLSTKGRTDMVINETTLVPFLSFNSCNGEPVTLSGTLHYMLEITTPSNGSFHYRETSDYRLTGVGGITGTKYEGSIRLVKQQIVNSGAATVLEDAASGRLIARGNVPNLFGELKTATTINANGEVKHSDTTFRPRCQ